MTASPPPSLESADGFDALTSPYRGALLAHCYRMLGSMDDAEDAVQEALVRAWRGRATFTEDVSLRAWLYRIATNVALDAIGRRRRTTGPADRPQVEPIPEDLIAEPSAGPEARYDARESISLAFLTALQVLSPRQRSVLILRDVLGWRAAEAADQLGLSVPAANSALHRARVALAASYPPAAISTVEPGRIRTLLERYVRAWEAADIPGLVRLLREDAVVSMPPGLTVIGRLAIAAFLESSVFDGGRSIRLTRVRSNGEAVFRLASRRSSDATFEDYAVLLVELDAAKPLVTRMTVFIGPGVIDRFGRR